MAIHSKKDAFSSLAFSSHSPPTPPGTSRQMAKDAGGICAQKVEVFLRLSFLPFPAMASAVIRIPFQWPSAKSNRARERIGRCRGWSESKVFNLVEKWKRGNLMMPLGFQSKTFTYLARLLAGYLLIELFALMRKMPGIAWSMRRKSSSSDESFFMLSSRKNYWNVKNWGLESFESDVMSRYHTSFRWTAEMKITEWMKSLKSQDRE